MFPMLSYVHKYEELLAKCKAGQASQAELMLPINGFDQAELHAAEKARDLSVSYLKEWLPRYKFKSWTVTQTQGLTVTSQMKEDRAKDIADALNDHTRWKSHGRGLPMHTVNNDLNLLVHDFSSVSGLPAAISSYYSMLLEGMRAMGWGSCVHARNSF